MCHGAEAGAVPTSYKLHVGFQLQVLKTKVLIARFKKECNSLHTCESGVHRMGQQEVPRFKPRRPLGDDGGDRKFCHFIAVDLLVGTFDQLLPNYLVNGCANLQR